MAAARLLHSVPTHQCRDWKQLSYDSEALLFKVMTGLLILNLGGCASLPSDWPQPVTADLNKCPIISGVYRNNGKGASSKHGSLLSLTLFPQARKTLKEADRILRDQYAKATRVEICGPAGGVLSASAWKDEALIGRVELMENAADGFACTNGAVSLGLEVEAVAGGGVFVGGTTAYLIPASDHSLLVNYRGAGAGLVLYVLPIVTPVQGWSHYATDGSSRPGCK